MIKSTHLQKLLNVRLSEWKIVTKLFWLQFFQGTGIAFFFTASFTLFLKNAPATELAWVMIISSPLLLATGWLFNKFEHKLSLIRLGSVTVIAMTISILLFHIASMYIKDIRFYYAMFAWYYVLYLASNLGFWAITSDLFDVRQSKRLFSVISAGDIPAKFIGYTVAYLFVKTVGPINLLWLATLFMLCSLPFLFYISKMGVITNHHSHTHNHSEEVVESSSGNKLDAILKRFTLNPLIRRVAILTFVISCCLAIINYAFYTQVKEANQDDKDLSNFILLFLASAQIIAMIVKLIFTSRITTSLGTKKSLFITPVILISLLLFIISADMYFENSKIVLYSFGAAAIFIEVLRNAINAPVFLSVMQPLSPIERSKAHAIVKGIMDPFAFLFSGALLLLLTYQLNNTSLPGICIVLLIFTILWLLSIFLVDRSYREVLLKAISSRFFSQDDFTLSDDEIQKQIKKKIKTGNELEMINILQMLDSHLSDDSKEIIFSLLDHPSDKVKKETILLISNRNLKGATEKLQELANHSSYEVQWLAVQSLCKATDNQGYYKIFSNHADPHIRSAAFSGMLLSTYQELHQQAEKNIADLINSTHKTDKLQAIFILNTVKNHYTHPLHIQLFDESKEISTKAIHAIGKSATPDILNKILNRVNENQKSVFDALHIAGEKSISVIYKNISSDNFPIHYKEGLISLLGKIGGGKAHDRLITLLTEKPIYMAAISKALHRSRYRCNPETQVKIENICSEYLVYGIELLHMQKYLQPEEKKYSLLISALNLELLEIRNLLLSLFGCLHEHENIFKIKQGLDMKKKESVANAMEVIEVTVKKELAATFNILFEPIDIEHRCYALKNMLTGEPVYNSNEILNKILEEKPIHFTSWTKAYSLYVSKINGIKIKPELIEKYMFSKNLLLQETAQFVK